MGYDLLACLVIEVLLTAVFLWVILGATDSRAPKGLAPLAIGLSLTLIHLISIPVTNTSVNPARSIGVGLFAGSDAISQLWLFILAPIAAASSPGSAMPSCWATTTPSACPRRWRPDPDDPEERGRACPSRRRTSRPAWSGLSVCSRHV